VRPAGTSDDGRLAHLQATLSSDPYGDEAIGRVAALRAAAAPALVGGPTAEVADTRTTTRHDERLIVPVTLLAILLILVVLLRAVVAPLYLIASVILSFAATMGLSYAAFRWVFDSPGSDASLPLFVFLFVVAHGVLVDTFVVRTLLVPAAAFLLGSRSWWPVGLR